MEIWKIITGAAANFQTNVKHSGVSKASDVGDSDYIKPCVQLFSGCCTRIFSADFSQFFDDLILATFFGGFCVLLWHLFVLFCQSLRGLIKFRGRGGRFLYRSRSNLTIPFLEQIQRIDRGTGGDELRSDIRAAGDSLEQDVDARREGTPRIMVMFLQSPNNDDGIDEIVQHLDGSRSNTDRQQRSLHGILMANDILEEIRRTSQDSLAVGNGGQGRQAAGANEQSEVTSGSQVRPENIGNVGTVDRLGNQSGSSTNPTSEASGNDVANDVSSNQAGSSV